MYVECLRIRKGVVLMETTGRKQCAATAEEILAMFRLRDVSLHVVLWDGREMLNLEPNADGSII